MIGTTLDKYEVLQKVGEGGMATVYRGRHSTLNRDVAIKVLHPHLSSSTRNRKRFAREARAIEHLRHDNILEIFDYSGMDAEECYIITEFVEGETLNALLKRRGAFPSEVTAIVGLHLARALAYAHDEGILHRDLKPDNVMVRCDGTIKLMDFGIARFLDESQVTMTGALVGSPAFMSPEQARELPLDQRSDLFSLGTMLFYLVSGHLPFSGSNPSLILKNVIEGNRPSVSELAPSMSATLADVIERLMATSPEDRYVTAQDVLRALENALAEANVDADDARWRLQAWITDPEGYERRLEEHLREVLLLRGRQFLDAGDHLAALRLFNRLLSMDEDNAEVLELVQGLHGEARRRPTASILGIVGFAALVVLVGGYLMWPGGSATGDSDGLTPIAEASTRPGGAAADGAGDPGATETPGEAVEDVPEPELVAEGTAGAGGPSPEGLDDGPTDAVSDAALPSEAGDEDAPRALPVRPRPRTERPPPIGRVIRPEPRVSAEAAPEVAQDEPRARIRIRSKDLPGEIFVDGIKMGETRDLDPLLLPPGSYDVVVKSQYVQPVTLRVEVEPGELFESTVDLQPIPGEVEFRAQDYGDSCVVSLDGARIATVGQLGRILSVKRPNEPHDVEVECGERRTRHRYPYVPRRAPFPSP